MSAAPNDDQSCLAHDSRRVLRIAVAAARAEWDALRSAATEAREARDDRAKVEEALLQTTLFCGFPRVVSAFEHALAAWPAPAPVRSAGAVPQAVQFARGRELFAAIYGKNDEAVRQKLMSFHPDFHDFVLESAYGRVLCRSGLDVKTRELLAVALLAALGQLPQLIAHARGAMRFSANVAEVRDAMRIGGIEGPAAEDAIARAAAGLEKS
jgi:4-carboxymuconolactone decarboxylase